MCGYVKTTYLHTPILVGVITRDQEENYSLSILSFKNSLLRTCPIKGMILKLYGDIIYRPAYSTGNC